MNRLIHIGILGYSRDRKGKVINYHENIVANTITTHSGGGGNTDQFVIEYYEDNSDWEYCKGGEFL